MNKPTLLLDCDGVLYQLTEWVLDSLVNPQLGTAYTAEDVTDWKWSGLPQDARDIFFGALDSSACWDHGAAYPDVAEDTQRLAQDWTIVVVTAMRKRYEPLRRAWLDSQKIPYSALIATSDKLKAAREVGARAAIEDYPVTADLLGRNNIPTWLVTRPWNRFAPIDHNRNVARGSWSEGVAWLERYAPRLAVVR